MRAKHGVGIELLDESREAAARTAGKQALNPVESPRSFRTVGPGKYESPQLRRALDKLDVTGGVDLSMERGKEFHQVYLLDNIVRAQGPPRFVQSRRRGEVSATRRDRRDQNAHGRMMICEAGEGKGMQARRTVRSFTAIKWGGYGVFSFRPREIALEQAGVEFVLGTNRNRER
jgi:hypothetical protein